MKDFHMWVAEMEGAIPDASHFVREKYEENEVPASENITPGQKALNLADSFYDRDNRNWFIAFQAEYSYALNPDVTLLSSLTDFLKLIVNASAYKDYAHHIEKYVGWNKL